MKHLFRDRSESFDKSGHVSIVIDAHKAGKSRVEEFTPLALIAKTLGLNHEF